MNTTSNNSYLTDPLAKLQLMQDKVDMLYAGYRYRQAQRELAQGQDTKAVQSNDQKMWDIFKGGVWGDYSKGDVVTKVLATDKDGNPKYDKKGNPVMKNLYHAGAIALNFLGNTAKYGAFAMSFMKDKETANNTLNDYATSFRKQGQQTLLSSGNPYLMAAGALSMLSDKVGGTASASQTGNFWTDAGNTVASFVPFLGFAGKKAGEFIERDDVNASSLYSNIGDVYGARAHSKGSFVFKGNDISEAMDDSNIKAYTISNDILQPGKRALASAMDNRWKVASQFELNGGYNQVGQAKHGAILQFTKRTLSKTKVRKQQNGGTVVNYKPDGNIEINLDRTPTFEEWVKLVPKEYQSELYDLKAYYEEAVKQADFGNPELLNQLNAWLFAITRPTKEERDFYGDMQIPNELGELYNPYHLGSIIPLYDEDGNETGEYMFVKLGTEENNPELHWETDEYKSGRNGLKDTHDLVFEGDRYYYRLKNPEKFKEGGKVNVIPEGALHKNKHHLEEIDEKFEDVTTKGIPVIVESEGGEVVLLAEVERLEIIFRLEVTKKLEKLAKEHTDEAAIEAGKLLVLEILYNTIDNTLEMI